MIAVKRTLLLVPCLLLAACTLNVTVPLFGGGSKTLSEVAYEEGGSDKVLVIPLEGTIAASDSRSLLGGSNDTVDDIVRRLNKARKDDSVKAIILKVNSPGGGVAATDTIYCELMRFKEERDIPIVAYFQDMAASGGYYAAMSSDYIVAQRVNRCGSIGVLSIHVSVEKLMNELGVETQVLRTGEMKGAGLPFTPLTDDQLELRQAEIEEAYEAFLEIVANGRPHMKMDTIRKLADGRVYTASKALGHGLIDEIGAFSDAVDEACNLAAIENPSVVTYTNKADDVERTVYTDSVSHSEIPLASSLAAKLGLDQTGHNLLYLWSPE